VLFSDFTSFFAHYASGLRWRSDVASEAGTLVEIQGDDVGGAGFVNGAEGEPVRLNLATGLASAVRRTRRRAPILRTSFTL
jgi:hypothetical protein